MGFALFFMIFFQNVLREGFARTNVVLTLIVFIQLIMKEACFSKLKALLWMNENLFGQKVILKYLVYHPKSQLVLSRTKLILSSTKIAKVGQ